MAPKKNAFSIFIYNHRNEEIKKGNTPPSFQQLATVLTPLWNSMSAEEKNDYKILANEKNLNEKADFHPQIRNLHNNSDNYWIMHKHLSDIFENIKDEQQLLKKKFILLHVNCHAHVGEQYYFPAEIAAIEFNLSSGISRTFHRIIGISKIYPRGFAGGMRAYSDQLHQISCWNEFPDDYKTILLDFLKFLKGGGREYTDISQISLDLPYMYTLESDTYTDMMKTQSSLERLYKTVFPKHDFECSNVFKVGSIERLLIEIRKKFNYHLDSRSVQEGMSVRAILESDMYGTGLGCTYHEIRSIAFKCSKARVFQWMSNICKDISKINGLQLTPGRHTTILLRDGSRLITENPSIPLTKHEVKVDMTKINQMNELNMTHGGPSD